MCKLKTLIITILFSSILFSFNLLAQSKKETKKQEKKDYQLMLDSLEARIYLAKYINLSYLPKEHDVLISGSDFPYSSFILGIRDFTTRYLKLQIKNDSIINPETVIVLTKIGEFNEKIGAVGNFPFTLTLKFLDNKEFTFTTKVPVNGNTNFRTVIYNTCQFQFPIEVKRK